MAPPLSTASLVDLLHDVGSERCFALMRPMSPNTLLSYSDNAAAAAIRSDTVSSLIVPSYLSVS